MAESHLQLLEPCVITDTFVSGVGDMEEISPNLYRVTYYAKQRNSYTKETELVAVAKFIVTFETLLAMSSATVEKRNLLPDHMIEPTSTTVN